MRIIAAPGELEQRADDLVRTIERLTGRELLKSEHTHEPQFEYPVLEQAARRVPVDRIRRKMIEKLDEVLKGL